jgi:hypothetical protein
MENTEQKIQKTRKELKDYELKRETTVSKQFLFYIKTDAEDSYKLIGVLSEEEAETALQDIGTSLAESIEEENKSLALTAVTALFSSLESEEEREKRLTKNILLVPIPSSETITAVPIFELN